MPTQLIPARLTAVKIAGAALAATLGLLSFAHAQDVSNRPGWYIGGTGGITRSKVNQSATTPAQRGSTGVGGKFFGGYRLNRNIAVELSYVDLGKTSATTQAGTKNKWHFNHGVQISALGIVPVNDRLSVFGKLGGQSTETKATRSGQDIGDRNESVVLGVGALYEITQPLSLRTEWEHANSVGDQRTTGQGYVDFVSVGVNYKF